MTECGGGEVCVWGGGVGVGPGEEPKQDRMAAEISTGIEEEIFTQHYRQSRYSNSVMSDVYPLRTRRR
jgi:hypothetical protein